MRVAVVGTGYVGLVTGAGLADRGHEVVCVDLREDRVAAINRGETVLHEPGLGELLGRTVSVALRATTELDDAMVGADIVIIAVGTPFSGAEIDLTAVRRAAAEVGALLATAATFPVVVVKSTVVPGTTDEVVTPILEDSSGKRAGVDFGVATNPEFLSEGQAVRDFLAPDRIVIGSNDERSLDRLAALYEPFAPAPIIRTNARTAEMIKYASNALQATLISWTNEFANLSAEIGDIDIVDVMRGVNSSHLLTLAGNHLASATAPITSYLAAGCGFGGSCFPKDLRAIAAHGARRGMPMHVTEAVLEVNDGQPGRLVDIAERGLGSLRGRAVTVLGLAFKPDTDDVRESPAFPIVEELLARGARVVVHDPIATPAARHVLGDRVTYAEDLDGAVAGADAVVLVTPWESYRHLPALISGAEPAPLLVDGRRWLPASSVPRYEGIGRRVGAATVAEP
jgi:UDPglucose 6-dehydrogenase